MPAVFSHSSPYTSFQHRSVKHFAAPVCPVLLSEHPPNPDPSKSPYPSSFPIPSYSPLPSFTSIPSKSPSASTSDKIDSTSRIVGGLTINSKLSSYIALIKTVSTTQSGLCTATIIGKRILLTAAHCMLQRNGFLYDYMDIFFGAESFHNTQTPAYVASNIVMHPNFNYSSFENTSQYDIAWILLRADIPSSASIMTVNANLSVPTERAVVRSLGYGLHHILNNISYPDTKLHQVDVPVTPNNYCDERMQRFGFQMNFTINFCAGYYKGGCGSCFGDSGGPVIQYDAMNNPVLVGITIFTSGCDLFEYPSIYLRVAQFTSFLPFEQIQVTKSTNEIHVTEEAIVEPFPSPKSTQRPTVEATEIEENIGENGSDSNGSNSSRTIVIVVVAGVLSIALIATCVTFILWTRRKSRAREESQQQIEA